jgi:hypothetical protein
MIIVKVVIVVLVFVIAIFFVIGLQILQDCVDQLGKAQGAPNSAVGGVVGAGWAN